MSFRELRSFTEKMRALGYSKLISMDSFRTPNFELMADIMSWLIRRYDPHFDVPEDIETEQERVMFVRSIAMFLAVKSNIRLNTRKLYMADGYAVKEMLKLANVLYEANRTISQHEEDSLGLPPLDISAKLPQLKACRALASEIIEQGSRLYDSLGRELELRDLRQAVIARPVDLRTMEGA
ncbi:Clusterin-associated protein 1, partial [Chytridiales sp. JEL 0842]